MHAGDERHNTGSGSFLPTPRCPRGVPPAQMHLECRIANAHGKGEHYEPANVRPLLPGVGSFQHVCRARSGTEGRPGPPARMCVASAAEKYHHWSHDVLEFVAGCVGGVAGIGVGHPFDTVKVRLQNDTVGRFKGPIDVLQQTMKKEGAIGLFKGIETPLISSVPNQAVLFGVYGVCLRRIGQYTREGINPEDGLPSADLQPIWHHVAAGIFTGAVQTPIQAASEYAKILMQNQYESTGYRNAVDVMRSVYRKHGLRTVCRGTRHTFWKVSIYKENAPGH